jgi:N-acetylneuraminic acid mutarotase
MNLNEILLQELKPLAHSSIVVTKNRVYLLGGYVTNVVYTASINNDGTLGAWTTGISLPVETRDASVIVTNNRVYLLGGGNVTDTFSTIYSAFINSDGTLGTWIASGNLPINLAGSQVVITKNRAYLCGGSNATGVLSSVYTAPINLDGTSNKRSSRNVYLN